MTNLEKVLQNFAADFEVLLKEKMYTQDIIASAKLTNTMEVSSVYINNTEWKVILRAEDYVNYAIETGRRPGKKPPYKSILDWIRVKQILPRPKQGVTDMTQETLAFLIRASIAKKGTPDRKLISKTLTDILTEYRLLIKEAIIKDSEQNIYEFMKLEFAGYNNVKIKIK
jgi:hypothetical protein